MPDLRAVVSFRSATGLPEDRTVNVWHFTGDDPITDAVMESVAAGIQQFYNNDQEIAPQSAVSRFYSPEVPRGTGLHSITFYDETDEPVGSPLRAPNTFDIQPALDPSGQPAEVAVVLSIHADLSSVPETVPGGVAGPAGDTKPRAQRRGRLYLGPLNNAAKAPDNGVVRPTNTFRTAIAQAAADVNPSIVASGYVWAVRSHKGQISRPVAGGWIDNAFDTQRRRGSDPTSRTTWAA